MLSRLAWLVALVVVVGGSAACAEDDATRPVMAGNRFVQPFTGEDLGKARGASAYDAAEPMPGAPGRFRIGALLVDASTRRVLDQVHEEITFDSNAVVRHDPQGATIWTHALDGPPGGVRPPDRQVADNLVFVVEGNAVVALDRAKGAEAWRVEGEHDRLLASGPLLLATSCSMPPNPQHGRCLVARETQTGAEVFRARLPDDSDPERIEEVGDLLLVKDVGFGGNHPAYGRFFDRTGKLRFELAECPAQVWPAGDGLVIVTPERTARIDPQGMTLWETKDLRSGNPRGAGLAALPGGDLLAWSWDPISDSGVDVMRVSAADGKVAWKTHCAELGVGHSKYWHRGYVEVRGEHLVVVSQAAGGHFVEVLESASGKSVKRTLIGG